MKGFLCVQMARASEAEKAPPTGFSQTELLTLQALPSVKKRYVDAGLYFLHSSLLLTSHTVLEVEKQTLNMCHALRSMVSCPSSTKFSLQMHF